MMKEPWRVDGEIFFYDLVRKIEGGIILNAVPGTEQQPSAWSQYTMGFCEGFLFIRYEHEPELEYHEIE